MDRPMNPRTSWRALLLAAATVLAACASPTAPEGAITVSTTTNRFTRDSLGFARISFRVSNSGPRTLFVPRCGAAVAGNVQRNVAGVFSLAAAGDVCPSSLFLGPLGLEAGQTVASTQLVFLPPGEYQLTMPVSRSAGDTPTGESRSAFFTIE
jgi:hypothetical protein